MFLLGGVFIASVVFAQQRTAAVDQQKMQEVYEAVKTPFKYGLVLVPESRDQMIDCPTVFRKGNLWYMNYLRFDGRGYETWLAKSEDLLHWKEMGRLMSHSADTTAWDASQKAGYMALVDTKWGGGNSLIKYRGKYWMSYFGGRERGYEAGRLSLGMAFTKLNPATVHEWERLQRPIFTSLDSDVRWWENKKQFKSTVIYDKGKTTGYPFVMYYNANGDTAKDNKKTRWFERIGMAVSNDMVHWTRFQSEPVVHHPAGITGDPAIQRIGNVWVMFYFGAFWQDRKGSFNRFACSYDLVHWTDWNGDNLIESSEPYDELYAHKSSVIKFNGVVYHFYCAVNKKGQRGIAVATSKDRGKSELNFISE
ncbi:MAG TPA: hypothetical protein VNR87_14325 [Flavisolibacter sp.]|nr:hypothetical protein [Flavisolibacter sp.]